MFYFTWSSTKIYLIVGQTQRVKTIEETLSQDYNSLLDWLKRVKFAYIFGGKYWFETFGIDPISASN